MRNIDVLKWAASTATGEAAEDSTLTVLKAVINITRPEEMPRGLDNFNLFKRLSAAFDEAEKSNILALEDGDYQTLKRLIERNIPSVWALNPNIAKAIEAFVKEA